MYEHSTCIKAVQKTHRMLNVTNAKSFHYKVITCPARNLFNAIKGVTTTAHLYNSSTLLSVQCIRGCSHIMSAKFGHFWTPPPPLVSNRHHLPDPPSPPSSAIVIFWLTPPPPFVILRQHLLDPPSIHIRYLTNTFLHDMMRYFHLF